MLFPAKKICGAFRSSLDNRLLNECVKNSIAARAPKYEPPIPMTTNTSESD